jgi:hypothetical protein
MQQQSRAPESWPLGLPLSDMMDRGIVVPPRGCFAGPESFAERRGARDAPLTGTRARRSLRPQAGARRDHRRSAVMDRVNDLARADSLQINRRDPEVRVSDMRVIWRLALWSGGGDLAPGVWVRWR